MSGETQARRRKDKRKKKDSVSDDGSGDEKGHPPESEGSSCLTVVVFVVLLAAVGVLLGLIYVQSQGIVHVDTPAPPKAEPRMETVVETITEGVETAPTDDQKEGGPPAGEPEGSPVEVVEQVVEEHIVYVDADGQPLPQQPNQEQVVYVDAPQEAPAGIQLEGSEPQLEERFAAPPPAPAHQHQEVVREVQEEKMVRMRQVVKQITSPDGTVKEEIVSEEVVEDDFQEPTTDQAVESESSSDRQPESREEPEQQRQEQQQAAPEADEGVDVTEPAEDAAPPAEDPAADEALVEAEEAPVEVEEAPVEVEEAPVKVKEAPVEMEEAPVKVKEAPVEMEEAPVEVKEAVPLEQSVTTPESAPIEEEAAPVQEEEAAADSKASLKMPSQDMEEISKAEVEVEYGVPREEFEEFPEERVEPQVEEAEWQELKREEPQVEEPQWQELKPEKLSEQEQELPEQEQEVDTPAEQSVPGSVPPSDSVPVDTNTQGKAAETPAAEQKQKEAVKVEEPKKLVKEEMKETAAAKAKQAVEEKLKEFVKDVKLKEESVKDDKPKDPVKEEKPREPVREEKVKEPVKKEKPKEPVKEEKPKEPAKEEKVKEPVKEEKPKEPVKEENPKEPVKEERVNDPVKEEKPKEPMKEEKPKEPVKEERVKEPVKEEKPKEAVKGEKTKESLKEEKPLEKPVENSKPKPMETPVMKEPPIEKPKEKPTEKPEVKEAPTEKPAPKTPVKEAEEIERVRSGQRASEKKPETPTKPAGEPREPARTRDARADKPVGSATDQHAKHAAKPAADEGIVADMDEEPAGAAGYDKADVTGPEDWDIRQELDAADNMVDTDAAAALNAFGTILSRRPRSPRALWGRARALNAQSAQERSNNVLDKAIKAFRDVLDLDLEPGVAVPPELYRRAAETCVQQMRFRGELEQAARIQQRLIQKFPDDFQLRNHLATVFMTYGQNSAAEEVLLEVLRLWPDNGYAKAHLGFIRRQQNKHEQATELMQAGLDSDEPGVHDKRFYYALGDSYDRIGQRDLALKLYEEAVSRGLLLSVLQRSLINVDRLTGRPYWTAEQSGSQELIRELEASFRTIRGEMMSLLESARPEDGFQPEQEQLSKTGDWKQFTLFRRGRRSQYACVKTPRTCEIIDKFPEAAGCRRGQVKFSMMSPGTSVWPHTGPTNCRLRLHLGLKVPEGTGIRVAGEKRTWEEGKVLIIDDSFEHDVWNEGDSARFILIVDIWHPELTDEERRTLTAV